METYTLLRAFADSWFLLAMFTFFIAACVFAFWPSQRGAREDAAAIPLRDEAPKCSGACAMCTQNSNHVKGCNNG